MSFTLQMELKGSDYKSPADFDAKPDFEHSLETNSKYSAEFVSRYCLAPSPCFLLILEEPRTRVDTMTNFAMTESYL